MKKSITILAFAFGITGAFAQDLTSKKGEPILPEAGDWAIGIDATPFLNYAGNFFGKTNNNNAPTFNFFTNNLTITGKYFQEATTAYRGTLRIGFNNNNTREMVANRMFTAPSLTANGFPTAAPMVENSWKTSGLNIGLSAGIEKRKGKTRLQGFYGGEVGISLSTKKDVFEYGNTLAVVSTPPVPNQAQSVDVDAADAFGGALNVVAANTVFQSGAGAGVDARITERKNPTTFSFGVRGFIGAEYFVLPKLSIGGEFGWGLGLTTTGASETTYETVGNKGGGVLDEVGSVTIEGAKQGGFSLDTDNKGSIWGPTGTLRLMLHF